MNLCIYLLFNNKLALLGLLDHRLATVGDVEALGRLTDATTHEVVDNVVVLLNKLNIPEGRETTALFVYQFSILTFLVSVIQVPFMSSIIAHERMGIW